MSHYNSNNKRASTNKQRAQAAQIMVIDHPKLKRRLDNRLELMTFAYGFRGKEIPRTT